MLERELSSGFQERREKPLFQCSFCMGKHSVNIYSEIANFLPHPERLSADYIGSIPGWRVSQEPCFSEYSIVYHPSSRSGFSYKETEKTLDVFGEPRDYESGQALAYLSFWMMEAQRQAESMYTMHSSALAIEDRGVLLLGHSGAGKTSILLAQSLKS